MALDQKAILAELDYAVQQWQKTRQLSEHDDLSDLQVNGALAELVVVLSETIRRFAPPGSQYLLQANRAINGQPPHILHAHLLGIARGLRDAYARGQLQSVEELVHTDVFADFLEMAKYLLDEKYKDAAAVIIGGVLEEHLRKLALKFGVPIDDAAGKPRKASSLNDDLAKCAYDKLDQKAVTYLLDLRNKAAHGHYGDYDQARVDLMLTQVRDFLMKHPA